MSELPYPANPEGVPEEYTKPAASYMRHMWLAVFALAAFLVLYFGLAGWFCWTAYRFFVAAARVDEPFPLYFGSVCSGILGVFMLRSLFVIRRGKHEGVEVTANEQPELFRFLERLADDAKAPRPHRVFLSHRVNAGVFYDLSLANLVLRSRKNLEIGLGLVNTLTLSELKAVLAHEFGHFGQGSMAIGRWFYTAQQLASHIVVARSALDSFLQGISNIDIRVAWIGWTLRLIVWSIRSLFDSVFGWVVLAQQALSREMEFQADLVSASLSGSDALIHALYKLDAADDAMDHAISSAEEEAAGERRITDIFALQSFALARKREILDDPSYGVVPEVPDDAAKHRLFRAQIAHPPRMWATHPPNDHREENVKRRYLAASRDDRSSWVLFRDAEKLREKVTTAIFKNPEAIPNPISSEEAIAAIKKSMERRYFEPAYRGVYLGRSIARSLRTAEEMASEVAEDTDLREALDALYPESLRTLLEEQRELAMEFAMLRAVEAGVLSLPGKRLTYRGEEHHRRELPKILKNLEGELEAARMKLSEHDRLVRGVHRAAAPPDWRAYLTGLTDVIHYVDHRRAALQDSVGILEKVYKHIFADGRVTEDEVLRLTAAAGVPHCQLMDLHENARDLFLGETLRERLKTESWKELMGPYELGAPEPEHVGEWLEPFSTWVAHAEMELGRLASNALDLLLEAETKVAAAVRSGEPLGDAPEAPSVNISYVPFLYSHEDSEPVRFGWWERFQLADGWLPGIARLGTAGGLIGIIVWLGLSIGGTSLTVMNGLSIPLDVTIGDNTFRVYAEDVATRDVESSAGTITARTLDGRLVESLDVDMDDNFNHYVYNVLAAAPVAEWESSTGTAQKGTPKWFETEATSVLAPRAQLSTTVTDDEVLLNLAKGPPSLVLSVVSPEEAREMIRSRVIWNATNTQYISEWLREGMDELEDFGALLAKRIAEAPDDVVLRRAEQDSDESGDVCKEHKKNAESKPHDANWQYLAVRCEENVKTSAENVRELFARWKANPWLAYAIATIVLDDGGIDAALEHVKLAADVPALEPAAVELRVRLGQYKHEDLVDLGPWMSRAPRLRFFDLVRKAEYEVDDLPSNVRALQKLHRGNVQAAQDELGAEAGFWLYIVAPSEGASEKLVDLALQTWRENGAAEHSDVAGLYMYALALREGADVEGMRGHLDLGNSSVATAVVFIDAVHAKEMSEDEADELLDGLHFGTRAQAYVAAAILLGDDCPREWRRAAKFLLFTGERPFLR